MRLPLEGLVCAFLAASCSTNKPPETVDSTTLATSDTTVTTAPEASSELTPDTSEEAPDPDAEAAATHHAAASTAPATIGTGSSEAAPADDMTPAEADVAPANTKPDNTKVNRRDTDSAALTPIDQGENQTDLKLTQQIRKAVMADGSLSFTAKNVKIITVNGKVTLRGPVKTAAERASIEGAARKVAGPAMVDSQLEVAP